ncbi:MAG TPA: cyclic pyranopterin monophosphate synthase MoaC [Candidatus Ozemobacteraceae bacterium]|nr:cyclic pyranopterin monophosphate synthase MoaC [Candidatus Ozemobacteraceae bacterium]
MADSSSLTHLDAAGRARMVDVGEKPLTRRRAVAFGAMWVGTTTLRALLEGRIAKGDAWAAARLAGIAGAKKTADLIPLTHPLRLDAVRVHLSAWGAERVVVFAEAMATDRTGVEMEAMTAATVALLTLYDMTKAVSRGARIEEVCLLAKEGGKSGDWLAEGVERGTIAKLALSTGKGTPKTPCDEALLVPGFGLEGDAHGGDWHRQVSLLGVESIRKMQQMGLKVDFGSFAENVATSGVCLYELPLGSLMLTSQGAILEVTQIGKECHSRCAVYHTAGDCVMPREGIFIRVRLGSPIRTGDSLLVKRLPTGYHWTKADLDQRSQDGKNLT